MPKYRSSSVIVLLFMLLSTAVWAQVFQVDNAGIQRAIEVQEAHTQALLEVPGVVGTAVSARENGQPIIKIFAESAHDIQLLPRSLNNIPVVVEVTGAFFARAPGPCSGPPAQRDPSCNNEEEPTAIDPTARFEFPIPIGVSTGHPTITAGTVGARVTDGVKLYALSNNHVFAAENQASIDDHIIQPGTFDGGTSPADNYASLSYFEPIVFSAGANNVIDAAIAETSSGILAKATPANGYGTPKSQTIAATIKLPVKKYGRTTGFTKGNINSINAIVNVGYGSGVARFVDQIIIQPGSFSAGGDSGSLIVVDGKGRNKSDDRKPVCLLFAGSTLYTICNPIDEVLSGLGLGLGPGVTVTIDGE